MNYDEIIRQLKAPFPFEEVEAKIQVTSGDKAKGMAVFYLDARMVQQRLDAVLGAFNWRNEYIRWNEKSQICGLSIYNADNGEWITKYDGAENSDIEPIKGGLTDAFKRSAVLWGIGRYLYQIEGIWVEIEQRGKSSFIKDSQKGWLKSAYDKAVAGIFGATPNSAKSSAPSADTGADFEYRVQSVKPSGKESQLLELINPHGDAISAYVQRGDKAIQNGAKLKNVNIVQKRSSYGPYNLVNSYDIAA